MDRPPNGTANPLIRKLAGYTRLGPEEVERIEGALARTRRFDPRANIIQEGDDPNAVNVVLQGWACRAKVLPDGRRQIVALLLPGDMCDPYVFLLPSMDQTITALTAVTMARIPAASIRDLTAGSPAIVDALWCDMMVAADTQREWIVSLGQRSAVERLAHLFCEISARLSAVGLAGEGECPCPMTQNDLAQATGMSSVHVNRSLQELRANGLIDLRGGRLTIHDRSALADLAMFDPTYLRIGSR